MHNNPQPDGLKAEEEVERVEKFIRKQSKNVSIDTAVVGLSGGIDSSTTAVLTLQALPNKNLEPVFMPESSTPERDKRDVKKLGRQFDLEVRTLAIDDYLTVFKQEISGLSELTTANIKARIRMTLLYGLANEKNGLVVGTGNLSEWLLGYFTKYGDGAADIAPLLHLYKTEVKQLGRELEIPESIISKPPSAGLWDGQTDEEELGASYEKLDRILYCQTELGFSKSKARQKVEIENELIDRVYSMVEESEHKRKNPPSLDRKKVPG